MKLLIVDDQASVVQGIKEGIDWKELGVKKVYTAYNALDAKKILKEEVIHVMLCDIEMPVESGLQLFEWVCERGLPVQCIFLTSHAEFDYAKEAVHLGAFDYIIQPAPYLEISKAVSLAIKAVQYKEAEEQILSRGKIFRKQEISIACNVLRSYLRGASNQNEMEMLTALKVLPDFMHRGCIILIQIVKWHDGSEEWEHNIIEGAFENILSELFGDSERIIGLAYIEENTAALIIQNTIGELNPEKDILPTLNYFNSVCREYFKCDIAFYYSDCVELSNTKNIWKKLMKQRDDNIRLESGMFPMEAIGKHSTVAYTFKNPQIKYWQSLIKDGYADAMEHQAIQLLDKMDADGILDKANLVSFYQDFIQMIYTVMESGNQIYNDIFASEEGLELYRSGMKSINSMKELIRFTAAHFRVERDIDDSKTIVNKVLEYINEHLDGEIKRDDLSEHVHLSPDYLSRIFKKELGITMKEYIINQKMLAAQVLLQTTKLPISYVAAKMGYSNFSHFSSTYKRIIGHTPNEERAN